MKRNQFVGERWKAFEFLITKSAQGNVLMAIRWWTHYKKSVFIQLIIIQRRWLLMNSAWFPKKNRENGKLNTYNGMENAYSAIYSKIKKKSEN